MRPGSAGAMHSMPRMSVLATSPYRRDGPLSTRRLSLRPRQKELGRGLPCE